MGRGGGGNRVPWVWEIPGGFLAERSAEEWGLKRRIYQKWKKIILVLVEHKILLLLLIVSDIIWDNNQRICCTIAWPVVLICDVPLLLFHWITSLLKTVVIFGRIISLLKTVMWSVFGLLAYWRLMWCVFGLLAYLRLSCDLSLDY